MIINTKLSLTIDDPVIDQAKKYAKREMRSLADLVENYLKAVVSDHEKMKLK